MKADKETAIGMMNVIDRIAMTLPDEHLGSVLYDLELLEAFVIACVGALPVSGEYNLQPEPGESDRYVTAPMLCVLHKMMEQAKKKGR